MLNPIQTADSFQVSRPWPWQPLPPLAESALPRGAWLTVLFDSSMQTLLLSMAIREGRARALQAQSEETTWAPGPRDKPFLSPAGDECRMMLAPQISFKNKMFHMPPGELVNAAATRTLL